MWLEWKRIEWLKEYLKDTRWKEKDWLVQKAMAGPYGGGCYIDDSEEMEGSLGNNRMGGQGPTWAIMDSLSAKTLARDGIFLFVNLSTVL
jgi:hypothetical protein